MIKLKMKESKETEIRFNQVRDNVWESDVEAYTATAISRDTGNPMGIKDPAYRIEFATKSNGQQVYRLFKAHLGGYSWLKNFKTLDLAIKFVNSNK